MQIFTALLMINCFEMYFGAYYAYFAAQPHQF